MATQATPIVLRIRLAVRETTRDAWGTGVEVVGPDGYRVFVCQPPERP